MRRRNALHIAPNIMSAKAVAYPAQQELNDYEIKTGQAKKQKKKQNKTAEKNTSNGTLAKK